MVFITSCNVGGAFRLGDYGRERCVGVDQERRTLEALRSSRWRHLPSYNTKRAGSVPSYCY